MTEDDYKLGDNVTELAKGEATDRVSVTVSISLDAFSRWDQLCQMSGQSLSEIFEYAILNLAFLSFDTAPLTTGNPYIVYPLPHK